MQIRQWIARFSSLRLVNSFTLFAKAETGIAVAFDRRNRAFSVRKLFSTVDKPIKKIFNYSVDVIDTVHKSHIDFSNIAVRENYDGHVRGRLLFDVESGIPYCLELSKQNGEKPITIFHEIGHLIDLVGIGTLGKFESENPNGVSSRLLELSKDTPEVRRLTDAFMNDVIQIRGLTFPLPPRTKITLKYLLEPREIVARSYAQYIVEKSKSQNCIRCSKIEEMAVNLVNNGALRVLLRFCWNGITF